MGSINVRGWTSLRGRRLQHEMVRHYYFGILRFSPQRGEYGNDSRNRRT